MLRIRRLFLQRRSAFVGGPDLYCIPCQNHDAWNDKRYNGWTLHLALGNLLLGAVYLQELTINRLSNCDGCASCQHHYANNLRLHTVHFPRLHSLDIALRCPPCTRDLLQAIVPKAPHLKHLRVDCCHLDEDYGDMIDERDTIDLRWSRNPTWPSITSLTLKLSSGISLGYLLSVVTRESPLIVYLAVSRALNEWGDCSLALLDGRLRSGRLKAVVDYWGQDSGPENLHPADLANLLLPLKKLRHADLGTEVIVTCADLKSPPSENYTTSTTPGKLSSDLCKSADSYDRFRQEDYLTRHVHSAAVMIIGKILPHLYTLVLWTTVARSLTTNDHYQRWQWTIKHRGPLVEAIAPKAPQLLPSGEERD